MSFRDPRSSLEDILKSGDAISDFLAGLDLMAYKADLKTRSAVERQLQNLTKAAFRLGKDAETLCPTVDWRNIRGLGNALRHEYDVIVDEVIWEAIHDRLPHPRTAVKVELDQLDCQGKYHP